MGPSQGNRVVDSAFLGFVIGGCGYALFSVGLVPPSEGMLTPESSREAVVYLLAVPLGTVVTLGTPVAAYLYQEWIGPTIGLVVVSVLWAGVIVVTESLVLLELAPVFWVVYMLVYVRLTIIVDILLHGEVW